jgi:hypothetical protein
MKKLFFIAILCLLGTFAFAQYKQPPVANVIKVQVNNDIIIISVPDIISAQIWDNTGVDIFFRNLGNRDLAIRFKSNQDAQDFVNMLYNRMKYGDTDR